MIKLKSFCDQCWFLADANVPSLDTTENDDTQRPLPGAAEMDVCNLYPTENPERYITSEEKNPPVLSVYSLS